MRYGSILLLPVLVVFSASCARGPVVDESRLVDLSHSFGEKTIYWPTASRFRLEQVAFGPDETTGKWYASNDFGASEHGGTHIDAPIHFAEGGRTTDEIPLEQLVGPARVIDVREKCEADRDYRLAPEDVLEHERRHGTIRPGDCVIVWTGWSRHYPDAERYLGSARRGVADDLHFPGIGAAAARLLVERRIDLVGIDTASLDHGPSRDFEAHRILNGADIPGLENLTGLDKLPPRGATLIALPMKIEKGTGGPCRVVAILP
ncbi:MAG: cyclase family protein [Planctomycetota bacterium]|nr:cyclase family protein [Planctomycetota bacterium]